jgi:YbbR domain-containing protein
MFFLVRCALLASLLPCVVAASVFGQGETTSAILGQVTDATNGAIPSATVTITNRETGLERVATTDVEGRFNFPQLPPGTYSVEVEVQGF